MRKKMVFGTPWTLEATMKVIGGWQASLGEQHGEQYVFYPEVKVSYSSELTPAAVIREGNPVWGYIDTNGKIAIPFVFEAVRPFSEGFAAVCHERRWGYISPNGHWVVRPTFWWGQDFADGKALVYRKSPERLGARPELIDAHGNSLKDRRLLRSRNPILFESNEALVSPASHPRKCFWHGAARCEGG